MMNSQSLTRCGSCVNFWSNKFWPSFTPCQIFGPSQLILIPCWRLYIGSASWGHKLKTNDVREKIKKKETNVKKAIYMKGWLFLFLAANRPLPLSEIAHILSCRSRNPLCVERWFCTLYEVCTSPCHRSTQRCSTCRYKVRVYIYQEKLPKSDISAFLTLSANLSILKSWIWKFLKNHRYRKMH